MDFLDLQNVGFDPLLDDGFDLVFVGCLGQIEAKAIETLSAINYVAGEVSLDMVCAYESKRTRLAVKLNVPPPESNALSSVLGRISFEPLVIEVYSGNSFHRGRERFTLAHELAHHLLDHGRHLVRESCDSNDFVL